MRSRHGWIPNYHGAWAMIIAPPITGIILSRFNLQHAILLTAWWIGYFAFFAGTQWIRARRKERFTTALITYGSLASLATLALLIIRPDLWIWALAYVPLIAVTAFLTLRGQERSLLNDTVTVVAAGLTTPVAAQIGHTEQWTTVWVATFFITAYFIGTAFYVKTNIRERGNTGFWYLTGVYHTLITICAIAGWFLSLVSLWHVAIWILLTIRSMSVSWIGARQGIRISPKHIGFGEILATLLVVGTIV